MSPNPQFPADLVTFTEVIINRKFYFLCSINLSEVVRMIPLLNVRVAGKGILMNVLWMGRWTDRWMNEWIDGSIDRWIDR